MEAGGGSPDIAQRPSVRHRSEGHSQGSQTSAKEGPIQLYHFTCVRVITLKAIASLLKTNDTT